MSEMPTPSNAPANGPDATAAAALLLGGAGAAMQANGNDDLAANVMARAVMQAAQAAGIDPALAIANLPTLTDPKAIAAATEVTASMPLGVRARRAGALALATATATAGMPAALVPTSSAAAAPSTARCGSPKDVPGADDRPRADPRRRGAAVGAVAAAAADEFVQQHQHQAAHLMQQRQIQQQRAQEGFAAVGSMQPQHAPRPPSALAAAVQQPLVPPQQPAQQQPLVPQQVPPPQPPQGASLQALQNCSTRKPRWRRSEPLRPLRSTPPMLVGGVGGVGGVHGGAPASASQLLNAAAACQSARRRSRR